MSERIVSIKSLEDFSIPDLANPEYNSAYEGFEIVTDKQRILFGIDNESGCCEQWGHISSVDNFDEFIGADLIQLTQTDEAMETTEVPEDLDAGSSVFVNVLTSNGKLQFAVYNSHNGYYGHAVRFVSEKLNFEETV